jgi:hypothetical protein
VAAVAELRAVVRFLRDSRRVISCVRPTCPQGVDTQKELSRILFRRFDHAAFVDKSQQIERVHNGES